MSSFERQQKEKAKQQAQKVVARAAKDGKLTGKEFDKLSGGYAGLFGSGANNTQVANEIARAIRRNPELVIGKNATEATGVKRTKGGSLIQELPEVRTATWKGGDYSQTVGGRPSWDGGSPDWVQNSRGSYTFIGDLSPRGSKRDNPKDTPVERDATSDTPDTFVPDEAVEDTYGGGYTTGGSIAFNPGDDMITSVAEYGNDATDDYFKRFLPESYGVVARGSDEINASGRFHLENFVGKVPSLGDGKDLFKYYKQRIG